ncbi:MAG: hypothetical protein DMD31_17500, partial [Gemmatimonadetes bacterium]
IGPNTPFPGRMGVNTALTFSLLATALVTLQAGNEHARRWGEACAVTSGAIALLSVIGHVYGVPALTRLTAYATQMAVHTSATLLLLSLGVLAAFPDGRLKGLLASSGPGGMVTRRLVPTVFASLLLIGLLRLEGQRAGFYGTEFGLAIMTFVSTAVVVAAIMWSAGALDRAAAGQQAAEVAAQGIGEQLVQAQKMEAIGRLASGVAHDFNNTLTAIFGYVDLIGEGLPKNGSAHQDLDEVRKAAHRAAGLTRQLLAFSRQQILEPVVLNLNDLVEEIGNMVERILGEDVALRINLAAEVENVRADPVQLQQVIMNLVVNARDAMPAGGKLLIETANAHLTEQYTEMHRPVIPGSYVMLAVSDTGSGMDEVTKARIFEPFFTTKEKGRGTGLGLSTVYGIVKQSGGYIWTYSEVGRGTTFKVYLPRVEAPAEQIAPPREAKTVEGTETILLAEDDEMLRPLAKSVLERLGYTVLEAKDGDRALAVAGTHSGPVHLLVSDVVMPGGSGRDLARRLVAARPETKVLYVSGYTDDAIVQHGMLESGLHFLQKPFTPAVLARKIREVLDAS